MNIKICMLCMALTWSSPFQSHAITPDNLPGLVDTNKDSATCYDDTTISYQADDQYQLEILTGNDNMYAKAVARQLRPLGFNARGYGRDQQDIYIHGLRICDLATGQPLFMPGLSELLQVKSTYGLEAGVGLPGGLAGSVAYESPDTVASKESRISYQYRGANNQQHLSATHCTGSPGRGWFACLAGSFRLANGGYTEGIWSYSSDYCLILDKRLTSGASLHMLICGGSGTAAGSMPAVQEVYELSGTNGYNPLWGYQQGERRNAAVTKVNMPLHLLQYTNRLKGNSSILFTTMLQRGKRERSGLDWYDAPDPRADYYKKLPSWYAANPALARGGQPQWIAEKWRTDPAARQIDWDNFYEVNNLSLDTINGVAGRRSAYVLGADVEEVLKAGLAARFRKQWDDEVILDAGMNAFAQRSENYRNMLDLLGGDYYVNVNAFAEKSFSDPDKKQIDLQEPDRIVKVGDRYAYNYRSHFLQSAAWIGLQGRTGRVDWSFGGMLQYDGYGREGLYRNGLFPDSSLGRSRWQQFVSCRFRMAAAYAPVAGQQLFARAGFISRPPLFDQVFISPKTRNSTVEHATTEQQYTWEAGYQGGGTYLRWHLAAFGTERFDATEIRRFYYEPDNSFVNYVLQHIDTRHLGAELALKIRVLPSMELTATATWMQVRYRSNPEGSIYRDNDTTTIAKRHIAYLQQYHMATGPQSAYTVAFNYRPGRRLQLYAGFNLTDRNDVDINPLRHTAEAVDLLAPGSPEYAAVLGQERLASVFTIDLALSKTFAMHRLMRWLPANTRIRIDAGVSNLLNRKDQRIAGFDQLRFDYDTKNSATFPTKYTYGFGADFFARCSFDM